MTGLPSRSKETPVGSADEELVFRIGEAAELTRLSVRTLRHWDQVGLVVPRGRTEGGYRLYTSGDLELLLIVRYMKPMHLTVEEMRTLLADRELILNIEPRTDPEALAAADRLASLVERVDHRVRSLTDQLEEVLAFGVRLRFELETGTPTLSRAIWDRPNAE